MGNTFCEIDTKTRRVSSKNTRHKTNACLHHMYECHATTTDLSNRRAERALEAHNVSTCNQNPVTIRRIYLFKKREHVPQLNTGYLFEEFLPVLTENQILHAKRGTCFKNQELRVPSPPPAVQTTQRYFTTTIANNGCVRDVLATVH